VSTGVARIIARSRKRGEAKYGMVGKEDEPNDVKEDWPVGCARREEKRKEAKKEEGGKERNGSLRHDL